MRVHSRESGIRGRIGVSTLGVIGGLMILLVLAAASCSNGEPQPNPTLEPTSTSTPTSTPAPTPTETSTLTPTDTPMPTSSPTARLTPTPEPTPGSTPTSGEDKDAADYTEAEIAEIAAALNREFLDAINSHPKPDLARAKATYSAACQPDDKEFAVQVDSLLELFESGNSRSMWSLQQDFPVTMTL